MCNRVFTLVLKVRARGGSEGTCNRVLIGIRPESMHNTVLISVLKVHATRRYMKNDQLLYPTGKTKIKKFCNLTLVGSCFYTSITVNTGVSVF